MRKVLFLDRDGVVNHDPGDYTFQIEKFKLLPEVIESLTLAKQKGFVFILITNQGGISKRKYAAKDVVGLHQYLKNELLKFDLSLLDIYYCPHHSVNEKCLCRKPERLMIEKAIYTYGIDVKQSVMIGDKNSDVKTAIDAGINSAFKIETNSSFLSIIEKL